MGDASDAGSGAPTAVAGALLRQGQRTEAEAVLRQAVEAGRADAETVAALAFLLHGRGAFAEALAVCDRALARLGDQAALLSNRAAIHARLGHPAAAIADLRAAAALAPTDASLRDRLATALSVQGLWAEAAEHWAALYRAGVDAARIGGLLAGALVALGRSAEALPLLETPQPGSTDALNRARALLQAGRLSEAGALIEDLVARAPSAAAWTCLGDWQLAGGESDAALASWRRALAIDPFLTPAFTRLAHYGLKRTVLLRSGGNASPDLRRIVARDALGLPERPPAARGQISVSLLGRQGRFGDQLGLYAVARLAADRFGLSVATDPWVGQMLYGLLDPPLGPVAVQHLVTGTDSLSRALADGGDPQVAGRDIVGSFRPRQFSRWRDEVRTLYRPAPVWRDRTDAVAATLAARGRTVVAVHLRRTDFKLHAPAKLAPPEAYRAWLESAWPGLDAPVLYVASDDLDEVLPAFAAFSPLSARDLGDPFPEAPFFPDFHVLSQADLLAVCDSGFSRWAALLNERARQIVRPTGAGFAPYDPWDQEDEAFSTPWAG